MFFTTFKMSYIDDTSKYDMVKNSGDEIISSRDWITNGVLDNANNWLIENGTEGDINDISSDISIGEYNSYVLGSEGQKSIILNSTSYSDWQPYNKTLDPLTPDDYGVDSTGCWVSHIWNDNGGSDQTPIIYFINNVTLDHSLEDYQILSASLDVNVVATVENNVDTPTDSYCIPFSSPLNQRDSYDYCRFSAEISDLDVDVLNTYEVGANQTETLGEEATSNYSLDDPLYIKGEQAIINALTNVLSADPGHKTFTILLGIYIHSADNWNSYDIDEYTNLGFDYLNLTFTYEKIIDQSTSIKLYQDTGSISDDISNNGFSSYNYYIINLARFNFSYQVEPYWPSASLNSEVRISLNNGTNYVSRKLNLAGTSFSDVSLNLIDLISGKDDIEVSIEVYIADEFDLNETIEVSIDNISFEIEYTIYFDDYSTLLEVDIDGQAYDGAVYVPVMRELDIVVKYLNDTSGHISDADVVLKGDAVGDLNENVGLEQYEITINTTDDLRLGSNTIIIEASKKNYELNDTTIIIIVEPISAEITGNSSNFVNDQIEASTNAPEFVQLYLNDTDNNLPIIGATVTYTGGLGNGIFTDPDNNGIYNATITSNSDGYYSITVSAVVGPDYYFPDYQFAINSTTPSNSTADLTIYLNNDIMPDVSGYLSIPSMRNVNITAVFLNETSGESIFGATVTLKDEESRFIGYLVWDSGHYTIEIDTSDDLDLAQNPLTVSAIAIYFPLSEIAFIIDVQPIQTEIALYNTNISVIEINTGGSAFIEVILNDTDNNLLIYDAVITYIWEFGTGVLIDLDSDGVYNTTILNIPEGSHIITISAITQGDYAFLDFELLISAIPPSGVDPMLYIIITAILGLAVIGLGIYFAIYQKILKYPPTVRKIRKLKGKIGKGKKPKSIDFSNRTSYIKDIYEDNKISAVPVSYKSEIKK